MTHDEFKALTMQLGKLIDAAYKEKTGGVPVGYVLCAVYDHTIEDGSTEQCLACGSNLQIASAARLMREQLKGIENEYLGLEPDAVRGHA